MKPARQSDVVDEEEASGRHKVNVVDASEASEKLLRETIEVTAAQCVVDELRR